MDLVVRRREGSGPGAQPVEVVERKGLGHPDTVCDGIAEHVCVCLCRAYRQRFGEILHHNVDKVLLCGGAARAAFGGGETLEPIELYLAGRATAVHRGASIDVAGLAVEACREWLGANLPLLDLDRDVRIVSRIRRGSADLTQLFARGGAVALANDTSCGAGFAPPTDLERAVLAVEQALNGPETKRAHPALGADVKVMGVRRDERITLTVGCAMVGRFLTGLADYAEQKAVAAQLSREAARRVTALPVEVTVNAADDLARGEVYLTVTGTSAEAGDDGEVGRGNRVCGLIVPYRTMTLEAAAGKNPVSHVGKLYNLAAGRIAEALCRELAEVHDASCLLVSRIGQPVDDPQVADVSLAMGSAPAGLEAKVGEVVRSELSRLDVLREELLGEHLRVY